MIDIIRLLIDKGIHVDAQATDGLNDVTILRQRGFSDDHPVLKLLLNQWVRFLSMLCNIDPFFY